MQCLLILVELKSTDLADAKEQILNAFQAIRSQSSHVKSGAARVLAVIVSSQGTPVNGMRVQKEMKNNGIELHFGTSKGSSCDLRKLLKLN